MAIQRDGKGLGTGCNLSIAEEGGNDITDDMVSELDFEG